ncbi:MAG: hypothetical protein JSW10_04960 [Pseudomonadota bacterium]|nr:MAG: hypothetical protein JSW10_04960 [Pseudomonadota bacterium]
MGQDVLAFEVADKGFDRHVIENSRQLPVLVEFQGAVKEMIITIANMLSPNDPEQAQAYRRRLANLLAG